MVDIDRSSKNNNKIVSGEAQLHPRTNPNLNNYDVLEFEKENFAYLFGEAPQIVCILRGPDHVFEFVNKAHIKALGFDATGMAVRVAQPESVEVHGLLDDVYNTGKTSNNTELPVTLTDRLRYFNLTYAARKDFRGQVIGVMILAEEVTDQVLARQQLELARRQAESASRLKSAFLANMSHEIRTPLGAIIGFAELLNDSETTEEERKSFVEVISRNGHQLSHIINDILDISKVESGYLTVETLPTDIVKVTSEVIDLLNVNAKVKKLKLELHVEDKLPQANTDPIRLKQILTNMIGNAIKFTEEGSVKVRVFDISKDGHIGFEITDTGIGIEADHIEKLFQVFSQADDSVTRNFGGTGLGLALSKKLAMALGGNVVLTNTSRGQGSQFLVTIKK